MNSANVVATPEQILHRLEWQVIRRLDGLLQGDYRTLFYGQGVDFADLREYQPQDDIRHIDWNVTARVNTPFVRQFRADRDLTAWFLLDLSPSMIFGAQERPKKSVLIDFVATMARLLTRTGNRVGAVLYGNGIETAIPPRVGRSHVLRLIHELQSHVAVSTESTTDLTPLLSHSLHALGRRAQLFLVSDFISVPGWERTLSQLNQRHDLLAIRIWDPREEALPDAGMIIMEDAETGEQLLVDTGDPRFRLRYKQEIAAHKIALQESFRRARADAVALSTEEDLVAAIIGLTEFRRRRARSYRG